MARQRTGRVRKTKGGPRPAHDWPSSAHHYAPCLDARDRVLARRVSGQRAAVANRPAGQDEQTDAVTEDGGWSSVNARRIEYCVINSAS